MPAFLLGPLGGWIIGALGVLIVIGGIYMKGRLDGAARVELRVQREVAAEQFRQQKAAAASLAEADRALQVAEAENQETKGRVAVLLDELAKRTENKCEIGDDDAKKLNAIR